VDQEQLLELTKEVYKTSTIDDLISLESKYMEINHPYKYYIFGVEYNIKRASDRALVCFLKASEIGLRNINIYFNSIFSDSVGSSLSFVLTNFNTANLNTDNIYNFFVNSYMFLSSSIKLIGLKAFDSLKHRAELFEKYEGGVTSAFIDNYGPGVISQVYVLSDYYQAAIGFKNTGDIDSSNYCYRNAVNIRDCLTINGKDGNLYSLDAIMTLGWRSNYSLFQNTLKDFQDNKFDVNFNMLRNLLH